MKQWGIAGKNVKVAKRIAKATEEENRKVYEAWREMHEHAKVLMRMVDHLDTEVEYGFITEEERAAIMKGLHIIDGVFKEQRIEDVKERVCERGAKRIAEKFGLEAQFVEAGDGE